VSHSGHPDIRSTSAFELKTTVATANRPWQICIADSVGPSYHDTAALFVFVLLLMVVPPHAEKRRASHRQCHGVLALGTQLSMAEECSLKPMDVFEECEKCPEMILVPAGSFMMGSSVWEMESQKGEDQILVTIAEPFAVGKFTMTFDERDACVADGGCGGYSPTNQGTGAVGNR
jgi:formylglycine-generating enzyme required for sulfatase activity